MTRETVYRLLTPAELDAARQTGALPKRAIDEKDGYFHLSAGTQLIETANLHFDGHDVLYAAGFPAPEFEETLKWELAPKRGEEFPHLYEPALLLARARDLLTLKRRPGGSFAVAQSEAL